MAQRKHLVLAVSYDFYKLHKRLLKSKIYSVFLLLIILISPSKCYTNAWLTKPNTFKYFSSFMFIDHGSRKLKNVREKEYMKIQSEMYRIGEISEKIQANAKEKKRELSNTELRTLEEIELELKLLEEDADYLTSFADEEMSDIILEYGINDNHSFGAKFGCKIDKFPLLSNRSLYFGGMDTYNLYRFSGNVDIFYKYNILKNNKWSLSLQPKILFDGELSSYNKVLYNLSLFVGYVHQKKNKQKLFNELGISVTSDLSERFDKEVKYALSLSNGIRYTNGLILSNYAEYSFSNDPKIVNQRIVYEQVSIAKEINFDKLNRQSFVVQLGYFWKKSLVDRNFKISGPIFSVWYDL